MSIVTLCTAVLGFINLAFALAFSIRAIEMLRYRDPLDCLDMWLPVIFWASYITFFWR